MTRIIRIHKFAAQCCNILRLSNNRPNSDIKKAVDGKWLRLLRTFRNVALWMRAAGSSSCRSQTLGIFHSPLTLILTRSFESRTTSVVFGPVTVPFWCRVAASTSPAPLRDAIDWYDDVAASMFVTLMRVGYVSPSPMEVDTGRNHVQELSPKTSYKPD